MAFDLKKGGNAKLPDLSDSSSRVVGEASPASKGSIPLLPKLGGAILLALAGWYFFGRPGPETLSTSATSLPGATLAAGANAAPSAAPAASTGATAQAASPAGAGAADAAAAGTNSDQPSQAGAPAPVGKSSDGAVDSKSRVNESVASASGTQARSSADAGPVDSDARKRTPAQVAKSAATPSVARSTGAAQGAAAPGSMIPARFEAGSTSVTNQDGAVVDSIMRYLSAQPDVKATVSGYASSEGDLARNIALATKRADTFKDYLVSKGVKAERIVAVGMGIERPVASNDTELGRAKNRRVEVTF